MTYLPWAATPYACSRQYGHSPRLPCRHSVCDSLLSSIAPLHRCLFFHRNCNGRLEEQPAYDSKMLTLYGVVVITFMMVMYALEPRDDRFVLGFALGCALSSSYGFASGAWPFGVVEAIWAVIAVRKYAGLRRLHAP